VKRFKTIIDKSKSVFLRPQDSFAYVAFGMSLLILISKVTGIVKYQVLAREYGIGTELDIFNAANTIPELIFLIVAMGGINAALIPVLTQTAVHENKERVKRVLSSLVNAYFIVMLFVCLLVFIFAPYIIDVALKAQLLKNDVENSIGPAEAQQFIDTLRILIFSPVILCVSSIFSCILQIRKRFFITQMAPLFYNLGLIFVVLFVIPMVGQNTTYLAWGVLLGSFLHFLVQLPAILKASVEYSPFILDLKDIYVVKAIKLSLPRTIGLASDYIGNIFQTLLALDLMKSSLSMFKYALALREIAVAMFGVAVAQALFPQMCELDKLEDRAKLQRVFSNGVRTILFWTLPVTSIFIVLRTPLVRLVFGVVGQITVEQSSLIAFILLFLSFGIVAYALLNLVNRAFYALDDSRTPTVVSIIIIFYEIALTYLFVNLFSHFSNLSVDPRTFLQDTSFFVTNGGYITAIGGMGLASSISVMTHLMLQTYLLKRKGLNFFFEFKFIGKKVVSALIMLVVGLISFKFLDGFFNDQKVIGILLLTINISVIMGVTYYAAEKIQGDEDIQILNYPIRKIKRGFIQFKKLMKSSKVQGVGT
jgi:putative peptidoglycan lipid II flippase